MVIDILAKHIIDIQKFHLIQLYFEWGFLLYFP